MPLIISLAFCGLSVYAMSQGAMTVALVAAAIALFQADQTRRYFEKR